MDGSAPEKDIVEFPALVADRYALEEIVGRGGVALVARVTDRATGKQVALKRLRSRFRERGGVRELFEQEYRTLAQLTHPYIVEVIDYGLDDDCPFYTMELLDGGDLIERAPLDFRRACSVAHDVCFALSLVHARGMVYRDLSPRNVRCTSDGKAKLIDFGAMAPTGSAKAAVCTPTVAAPEVVNVQPLDARTDLYALGALLYHTLTGHAPFAAKSFRQLATLWQQTPPPPSSFVSDVPEALDNLVTDLLQLDPHLRPTSAAEVAQRLAAIAGLRTEAAPVVVQSFLHEPRLVGRDAELERIVRRLSRLKRGGLGGAMVVRGPSGCGHSRLLHASVLQARVEGLTVVRVTADDAGARGAGGAIAAQLLVDCPEAAVAAAEADWETLARVVPQLSQHRPEKSLGEMAESDVQARTLPALRDWVLRLADEQPLVLAVDDIEELDADSRSLIALVAERSRRRRLLLLATRDAEREMECAALALLDASSVAVALPPLTAQASHELLASIFGDVPNLQTLVHHLHDLSKGSPRRIMLLAQHLLDQGAIQHHEGGFVLPERLSDVGAPSSMAEARRATVAALGDGALRLARAIALTDGQAFDFRECEQLAGSPDAAAELLAVGVLAPVGSGYRTADPEWRKPLLGELESLEATTIHARLALVFQQRGDGLRAARHLLEADEPLRAVDVLADHAARTSAVTNVNVGRWMRFLDGLPDDWPQIYTRTLARAGGHPRRKKVLYEIRNRFISIVSQTPLNSDGHGVALARTLAEECGLDLYEALDPGLDAGARLQQALGKAIERHEGRPEAERLFDPITALRQFATSLVALIGNLSQSLDFDEWERYPSIEPFAPLSPALSVVNRLVNGFDARRRGLQRQAGVIYREVLDSIAVPEEVGLDRTYVIGMRTGISALLGIIEATMGTQKWRQYADTLDAHTGHESTALLIRSLGALWQGDVESAAEIERGRERLRLEYRRPHSYEAMGLIWRFQAHAVSADLTRAAQELGRIERLAKATASWEPVLHWARGEYERLRGDPELALTHLDAALTKMQPGRHQLWPSTAAARLLALASLRQHDQAFEEGREQLAQALDCGYDFLAAALRQTVALMSARRDDTETAFQLLDTTLEGFEDQGVSGLNLGLVHETAASVAIFLRDAERFERHREPCEAIYLAHQNAALAAKYERLLRAARRASLIQDTRTRRATLEFEHDPTVTQLTSILDSGIDPSECLVRSLELVAECGKARAAYLITLVDGEPVLRAQVGAETLPAEVLQQAGLSLEAEFDEANATHWEQTRTAAEPDPRTEHAGYRQLLLGHYSEGEFAINGMLLLQEPALELPSSVQLAEQLSRFLYGANVMASVRPPA
ncbi:MAG: protein kinase [Myxococcales bacterium]|nr:protein kinase [Myxococcales bacterium]